jgi:hypothetical protein
MNENEKKWLENRVNVSVDDDFYLDRDEEKRIKEEAASRNIYNNDIEFTIRSILEKTGSVSERLLVDELDRLLHQFTDNDKRLDKKEEKDAMDQVLIAGPGKKKGLDPRVASEYVDTFCKANGIKRDSVSGNSWIVPLIIGLCIIVIGVFGWSYIHTGGHSIEIINDKERVEIDFQLDRAKSFVKQAQYTDPPERSAKSCLDKIRQIDPKGQYRGEEINDIVKKIVIHYLQLADKSFAAKDAAGVNKWIERAKLMGGEMELILEKEREYGLQSKKK